MNDYPYWWDKTITIYNKFTDKENDNLVTWHRTVVSGCFWKYMNTTTYVNNVKMETKDVICRIPKQSNYVKFEDWTGQEGMFTLNVGDIIILGEVNDVVDEYTKGSRATDLLSKYKNGNRAIQIDIFTEDVGKGLCSEHYHVKGI